MEMRSHYVCGMDPSPAKQIMAIASISLEKLVAWEVRSNTSHAFHVKHAFKIRDVLTIGHDKPTRYTVIIWSQKVAGLLSKLLGPVVFGQMGLSNLLSILIRRLRAL